MMTITPLRSLAARDPRRFGRADLQVHTAAGDGMDDARTVLERVELHGELDVIAVTDHDDIRGALEAREIHARAGYHFDLVTGIEVTTRQGHLLALWVDEPVPSLRAVEETIAHIHAAGGLAVVPHPGSLLTRSIGRRTLDRLLAIEDPATHPDALDVASPLTFGWDAGDRLRERNAERWGLAETGSSDAHFVESIGSAYTRFPGRGAHDLRRAVLARDTEGVTVRGIPYRQIGARRLALQQVRGLAATPRELLRTPASRLRDRLAASLSAGRGS